MSIIQFPPNPDDGTIFEITLGVFYRFNKGSNCWIRLRGINSLGLATPLVDGLMSKEDFSKLQNLILPPPQASLTGEGCVSSFKSGVVGLYSFDDTIGIDKNLDLRGGGVVKTEPWNLHQNTAGFNFGVPVDRIISEIEKRNQLKKTQIQGDQGSKGARGEDGLDRLDTGPEGSEGASGANSPFTGIIAPEEIPFELVDNSANRAIVDVSTEEISSNENYLVLTRANIGNPDACPPLVIPKDFQSFLLVALNTTSGKLVKNQEISSGDCSLICRICASSLHHVNIEPILEEIFEKFKDRVQVLKESKEDLVRAWLQTMVSMFNEQKSALCCALENCRSRGRNEKTRQYIETQRIQAAQGKFGLTIDGIEDRTTIDMDSFKDCAVPFSSNNIVSTSDGVTFVLDSKIHIYDPRFGNSSQSLTIFLPPGTYVAEITGCCAKIGSYTGRNAILYNAVKSIGSGDDKREVIEANVVSFPDLGIHQSEAEARNVYQGLTLTFQHAGGNISAWILDPNNLVVDNDGSVTVAITNIDALDDGTGTGTGGGSTTIVYAYRDELSLDKLLGKVLDFSGPLSAADNLGATGSSINLAVGPDLQKDRASVFFYSGLDGFSLFFVAGATEVGNTQTATIEFNVDITNNPLPMSVLSTSGNSSIKQLTTTSFDVSIVLDGNSAGFAIGPIDSSSDYSVTFSENNLSTMQTFFAADSTDKDVLLMEGDLTGIGGPIIISTRQDVQIFDVAGIPENFGGGNNEGAQVDNPNSGQNVVISRPIDLNVPILHIEDSPVLPTSIIPPVVPVDPPSLIPESLQETSIVDITLTINTPIIQGIRYILTDQEGVKYFSTFIPTNLNFDNKWQNISLGPPISIIAPPSSFTDETISTQKLNLSLVESELNNDQLKTARNLDGISRLTYVQSILGNSISKVADGRNMINIEIEFHKMPNSVVEIGEVVALVGLPGALTEISVDSFASPPIIDGSTIGQEKRTVATIVGSDSTANGLLYQGLTNYFADYGTWAQHSRTSFIDQQGPDASADFSGNNFFTVNTSGTTILTQITDDRGFVEVTSGLGYIWSKKEPIRPIDTGEYKGDSIVVDYFGGIYVADGIAGTVRLHHAGNHHYHNFGDVNDQTEVVSRIIATGLPINTAPVLTLGRLNFVAGTFVQEIIMNFGGAWFILDGLRAGIPNTSSLSGSALIAFASQRGDTTSPRCCFDDNNNPSSFRSWLSTGDVIFDTSNSYRKIGNGPAGNSIATSRNVNTQPSIPNFSIHAGILYNDRVQAQLDTEFNSFTLYTLDDRAIYTVNQSNGARTIFKDLNEEAFGMKINPVTKEIYYIVNNRGTTIPSGTVIRKVSTSGRVSTVWISDEGEGIFALSFANTLPSDLTRTNFSLYALISSLRNPNSGQVSTRLIEIAEPALVDDGNDRVLNLNWDGQAANNNNNPQTVIFSDIPPGSGCQMHYKQVQWYERGWRIGACCGALVEFGGVHYIVAKRSIGIDTSCGGGESESTPCIAQFVERGEGHPAIAWPTFVPLFEEPPGGGGEEFLGLPTSGFVTFVKDESLSESLLNKIRAGQAIQIKGNPDSEIPFILFPAS